MYLNFINGTDIFEFRETLTVNEYTHDFIYYGKYIDHRVINGIVTDYIEILKIRDIVKYLNGDKTVVEKCRYESNIPKDLIKCINSIRYSEGKSLINS